MRTLIAMAACLAGFLAGCSGSSHPARPYGAQGARLGESLGVLGWNMAVSNLRWDGDYVLVDVDAAPTDRHAAHAKGPLKDRSAVRGVYTYSPRDRIPNTAAAYGAAFPVGVLPTNGNDTGVVLKTTSLSAWRADGTKVTKAQLGDPAAFVGNGHMLPGLEADGTHAGGPSDD